MTFIQIEDIPGVLDYDGDNVPGQHVSTVPGVLEITTEDQATSGGHNYPKNIETGVI